MEYNGVEYEVEFNVTIVGGISETRWFSKMGIELGPFSRHTDFSIGWVDCR